MNTGQKFQDSGRMFEHLRQSDLVQVELEVQMLKRCKGMHAHIEGTRHLSPDDRDGGWWTANNEHAC